MANINLLPWRDEYRQEKKREFVSLLAFVLLITCVSVFLWYSHVGGSIASQEERNAILNAEIKALNEDVKEIENLKKRREELEVRINIIKNLQVKRPLVVRYFDGLARAVPEGLYFDSLKREGDTFTIKGVTNSNTKVSDLMRNLDNSEWFKQPNLKNVIADEFELSVEAVSPVEEEG